MDKIFQSEVSDQTVAFVSDLVFRLTGVELGASQGAMVRSRLIKHFSDLGIGDAAYAEYFKKNQAEETQALISLITTHHTYFFREYFHFEHLESVALPALVEIARQRGDRTIRVWSAACSRGQEVYSLSMCLNRFLKEKAPDIRYQIWGSDVDEKSVALAKNGVYLRDEIKEIPMAYLSDHWARGQGEISNFVKAKKSIKEPCTFEVRNLLHLSHESWPHLFDIIFCRNIFIYFSSQQVTKIATVLMQLLQPYGQLFVGISESLRGHNVPAHALGPSIYTHECRKSSRPVATTALARVLCVDDSPSILLLLKKMLTQESGFEVVGTAGNGLEAVAKVQTLKPDLVTLDIHMPVKSGLEYLSENMHPGHPPVVMVTSVNRDSIDLAHKAIELGAVDFVEKPSLNNFCEKSDEIRNKLRAALQVKTGQHAQISQVDHDFKKSRTFTYSGHPMLVIFMHKNNLYKLSGFLAQFGENAPPALVVMSEHNDDVGAFEKLHERTGALLPKKVYLATYSQCPFLIRRLQTAQQIVFTTSIVVFGRLTSEICDILTTWPKSQLLLQDEEKGLSKPFSAKENVAGHFVEIVPVTSFAYLCQEFFGHAKSNQRPTGTGGGR